VDEIKKMLKITRHPWMKSRKRQKLVFRRGGKSKTGKFCVWAAADERKMPKIDFRPRPKSYHPLILMHGSVYIAATEAERNDSPRERLDFRYTEFCFYRGLK